MLSPNMSIDDMRALIRNANPNGWPSGWAHWDITRQAMLAECELFKSKIVVPDNVGVGRGIITSAGPKHFPSLYVMLRRLRELGCTLPVEVWHMSELDTGMRRVLESLGATVVDANILRNTLHWRVMGGWQLKPYAALHSNFAEVFWIDADSIPRVDPTSFFDWPEYRENGIVVWPDFPTWTWTKPQWEAFGLIPRHGLDCSALNVSACYGKAISSEYTPPHETGQWIIDKRSNWKELRLAGWWNEYSDYTYIHQHGDVGMFQIAFATTGKPLSVVPFWPGYDTHSIQQHDFQGNIVFGHRTQGKFSLSQPNIRNTQPDEDRLHEILAELSLGRTPREQAIADILTLECWNYRRVGLDTGRPMTFLADGTIDHGSAGAERRWTVEESGGRAILRVYGDWGMTFEAHSDDYGAWRGVWLIGERMPVELIPGVWSKRVTVPAPPKLNTVPKHSRAIVTVAYGDYGRELFKVSGPLMQAYADRLDADLVVLDWAGHPEWPMSSKYGIYSALKTYDRIIYVDADVMIPGGALDLFKLTPSGKVGVYDESQLLKEVYGDGCTVFPEYRWLCKQQDIEHRNTDWYVNAGVMCLGAEHAMLLEVPSKPIPAIALAEQHLFNARLKATNWYHPLPREANWHHWSDIGFVNAPSTAFRHYTGFMVPAERILAMNGGIK